MESILCSHSLHSYEVLFVHYRLDGGNCGGFYILICCTSKGKSLLSCLKRGYWGKNILLYTVLGLKIRHSRDGGGEGRWFKSGILASGLISRPENEVILKFWILFRSERPVSTIFPAYILPNGTYERINKLRYPLLNV